MSFQIASIPANIVCLDCGYLCVHTNWTADQVQKQNLRYRHVDNSCKHAGKVFFLPLTAVEPLKEPSHANPVRP